MRTGPQSLLKYGSDEEKLYENFIPVSESVISTASHEDKKETKPDCCQTYNTQLDWGRKYINLTEEHEILSLPWKTEKMLDSLTVKGWRESAAVECVGCFSLLLDGEI